MDHLRSPLESLRELIARKLGACPYCMRTSALGTVVGWSLYTIGSFAPGIPLVSAILLAAASGFTLLLAAHLVAYMVRQGLRIRKAERLAPSDELPRHGLGRRRFLGLVLKAGAYALTIAFFRAVPALSDAATCRKGRSMATKPPTLTRSQTFSGAQGAVVAQHAALDDLIANFRTQCETACGVVNCMTAPTSTCYPSGDPEYDIKGFTAVPQEPPAPPAWYCEGELKKCPCDCYPCDKVPPPSPYDEGTADLPGNVPGPAGVAAEAAADQKCIDFCAKLPCPPSKTCKSTGKLSGQHKNPEFHNGRTIARHLIKKCVCKCQ